MSAHFFSQVSAAALADFEGCMGFLGLAGGKRQGREYLPLNPKRRDTKPGSFTINMDSGAWGDFATGDSGGDLVSLAAYILGVRQIEAAERLGGQYGIANPDSGVSSRRAAAGGAAGTSGPLSGPDAHGSPAKARKPDAEGQCIMPVPPDAPPPPVAHSRHGRPASRWAYTDAAGRVCFYHDRYEPKGERKQFAPLTLWRSTEGRLLWQFKAPPAPRPLLGLPDLAAKPGPVVVVEGEKARDAALALFPDRAVVCWQGGAQAVGKADWRPLAGRVVWLWPDADEAGDKAMSDVATALGKVGKVEVHRFALTAFARQALADEAGQPCFGGPASLMAGDDAADLVARGWQAGHIEALLAGGKALVALATGTSGEAAPPNSAAEDVPVMGRRFEVSERGVYLHEAEKAPRWVCARLDVVARVRDPKNAGWGLLAEFYDPDKVLHKVIVPAALFRGDGAEVAGLLLDAGLQIAPRAKPYLLEYLQTAFPEARARVTRRTGWHDVGADGAVFVLPDTAIGGNAEQWLFDGGDSVSTFTVASNLAYWRDEVSRLCCGNSRLLFAVSVAFAAPLLHLTGSESGGFHFVSKSSDGKTTILRVVASVCGGPDFMQRWRVTDNALEVLASQHCDAPLLLDELAQIDPVKAGESSYMLANGSAKGRSTVSGGARARMTWRLLFLSSGEIGLAAHMAEGNKTPRAGQEIRLAEIPSDAGAGLGAFEELHGYANGADFAKALEQAARKHYGSAFRAFLHELQTNREAVADSVRAVQKQFEQACLTLNAHGQAKRVAARFALVGAAGELATRWGITAWERGDAITAAVTCFKAWLAGRGGEGNQEEKAMLHQVRDYLRRKAESAFTDWDRPANSSTAHAPGKPDRAGYRRNCTTDDGHDAQEYFVFCETWRSVICKGFDPAAVGRLLVAKGYCRKGTEAGREWLVKEALPTEGRVRCVHVLPSIFDGE